MSPAMPWDEREVEIEQQQRERISKDFVRRGLYLGALISKRLAEEQAKFDAYSTYQSQDNPFWNKEEARKESSLPLLEKERERWGLQREEYQPPDWLVSTDGPYQYYWGDGVRRQWSEVSRSAWDESSSRLLKTIREDGNRIQFRCPSCKRKLTADIGMAGTRAVCQHCQREILIPAECCPNGHGLLRPWSGKLRCWTCGWPENTTTKANKSLE